MEINHDQTNMLTQEDKLFAAIAHAMILFPILGLPVPIVIWASKRGKSEFVEYQSLQALVYQICIMILWLLFGACNTISFFFFPLTMVFGAAGIDAQNPNPSPFLMLLMFIPFLAMGIMMLGWLLVTLYGLAGAFITLQGRNFRYIIIGKRVENFIDTQ